MFSWHSIPFSRVAIPLALGIGLSYFIRIDCSFLLGSIALLLLSFWLSPRLLNIKYRYNLRLIKGILSMAMVFLCGCLSGELRFYHLPSSHYSLQKADYLYVRILEIRKSDSSRTTAFAEVENCIKGQKTLESQGSLYLQIHKQNPGFELQINRCYLIPNKTQIPKPPEVPWEFDFAFYLKTNGIERTARIRERDIRADAEPRQNLYTLADQTKSACIATLRHLLKKPEYYGIAEGLLIGYRYDIDAEVAQGFTNSGTIHILSTSGMHVALIYGLLGLLTFFLKGNRQLEWLQYFILLGGLWLYAFVCGLGPSIVRATITFSIVGLGRLLDRKADILNLVFATAFFQLCFNPLELFQVAFQLSYAAVFGILTLNPVLNELWQPRHRLMVHLRDLITVSLSAQAYTWPLTWYYFGSFPTLFLPANLLLIPLSSLILYTCLALLAVQAIPVMSTGILYALNMEIGLNNRIARYLAQMEFGNIRGLHISLWAAMALGIAIMTGSLAIKYRQKGLLIACLCFLLIFVTFDRIDKQSIRQKEIIICEEKRKSIKYLIKGESGYIVLNPKHLTTEVKLRETEMKMKSRLGLTRISILKGNELFVSTNFMFIPGVGLQFFDRIMTLK